MANKKTPLLLQLRKNSGTVYVFPSASEDVGLNLNSDINGAAITHYALLNIPSFKSKDFLFEQYQLDDATQCGLIPSLSLQNYLMNMETLMLNRDSYNFQELETISEKCFWHWMVKTHTLDIEKNFEKIEYNGNVYYYEPNRTNNIVKCFGDIDAGNSLSTEFGIFNETYLNIPSSYGGGPVFFQKKITDNYPRQVLTVTNDTWLEGRKDISKYVSYTGEKDRPIGDVNAPSVSYQTDGEIDSLELVKDLDTINTLIGLIADKAPKYPAVTYDDINIDARKQYYRNNQSLVSPQFDFNVILLYYSIYDALDTIKLPYATNLFGIIFLDGVTMDNPVPEGDTTDDTDMTKAISSSLNAVPVIKGVHKRQTTDQDFGTSYSFRVNVKTMSIYDDTKSVIQDNTTFGAINAQDFSGAISLLNRAINILHTNMDATGYIQNAYAKVLSYYDKQSTDILDISTHLQDLLHGRTLKTQTLESLYCNKYYNVLDITKENPVDSSITFYLLHPEKDEYGKNLYVTDDDPYAFMIDHNGLHAHIISTGTSYHQKEYRVRPNGVEDYPIWINDNHVKSVLDESTQAKTRLNVARGMLEQMFESSTNLRIKLYYDPNNTVAYSQATSGYPILNYLYIDESSPVFDASSGNENIAYLKDTSTGFVDYAAFVPYIIALLQHINEKFNYTYDLQNSIYGMDDIKTIKDAIDFMMNIFHYDDMQNYKAELKINIYDAILNPDGTGYMKFDPSTANTQYTEDGIPYFFKGSPVFVEYEWVAAEPNNNMLSEVALSLPNNSLNTGDDLYINLIGQTFTDEGLNMIGGKWESPSIDQSGTKYIIDTSFGVVEDKELNPKQDIDVYSGKFYVVNPQESINTEITLKSSINSDSIRKLVDKTITAYAKCMVKCYYWTGENGTSNSFNSATLGDLDIYVSDSDLKYNVKQLETNTLLVKGLKYFPFEDRALRMNETPLNPVFKKIMNEEGTDIKGFEDMYVYFMLPYYDGIEYANIHVYVDYDAGVGGWEVYPKPIPVTDNGITTNYRLYRTNQKQNGFINIKIG